jgi:hypothetical protein
MKTNYTIEMVTSGWWLWRERWYSLREKTVFESGMFYDNEVCRGKMRIEISFIKQLLEGFRPKEVSK